MKMLTEVTGEGRPVVLVPGGLTGSLSWKAHADRLSATRKVVRVQLLNVQLGFESLPLPPDYSVKMESRALARTIDGLGLEEPVDLVAWSFGAQVTLDYALDNPGRVRTLTLIEPPAFWVLRANGGIDNDAREVIATLENLQGDISEDQLEHFAQSVGLLKIGQSGQTLPQWSIWVRYRLSLRHSPATIAHNDDLARLRRFEAPVLLLKGTGSASFLHQIVDTLAQNFPHVQTLELPAGHAPHIVSMDRFLGELEAFQSNGPGE